MKKKSLAVAVACGIFASISNGAEHDEYCVTTYSMPSGEKYYASEVRNYEPLVINDFNRQTYELPLLDGEVHIKPKPERYKLMAEDFGKESLYVVRHTDINHQRFNEPDIAFLAKTAQKASVVVDKQNAMVVTKSSKPSTINIKQIALDDRGYRGRVVWDEIKAKNSLLAEFIEFEFETAITINGKPYALAFTKAKSEFFSDFDYGTVLIDLQNPNHFRYTVLHRGNETKPLNGNVMYVHHYDNTVMVNVFDRYFKIKG